jgi:protein SCO1/2
MKLRLISRVLVLVLVVVIGGLLLVLQHNAGSQSTPPRASALTLKGADLGATPAPDFTLTDASGATVSLASLRGHPVVLTFLYTHCPDECPLTAEKLRVAAQTLGTQGAAQVRWVVVSVDPTGDTPASANAFVAAHHLTGTAQYLLGTQAQLALVWDAYHIAVQPGGNAQAMVNGVDHTVGVFVLDAEGRERAYLDGTFDPADLAYDLRALGAS